MRVLYVIRALGPGGAETLLVDFLRHCDRELISPVVAATEIDDHDFLRDVEDLDVPVVDLSEGSTGPLALTRALRRLWSMVKREPFDVVHIHSPLPGAVARLALWSSRTPRPVVVTTEHNTWKAFNPLTRALNAMTIGRDDWVFAVSHDAQDCFPPSVLRKSEVLSHGVPVAALRERAMNAPSMADLCGGRQGPYLISVANFRSGKDHRTMLEAYRRLVERGVPFTAFLVGQGELEHEIRERIVAMGLSGSVTVLGRRHDAPELMAACDLFVMSSRQEGLPVALMEAVAVGLPIVSTAVGGIPEAFGSSGVAVLVPPGDPTALANAIEQVLRSPSQLLRMRDAATELAMGFDSEPVTRRIERRYEDLCAAP